MKFRVIKSLLLGLLFAVASGGWPACAQEAPPSEYQVKAAFLYNFAKFVEWPPQAFPDAGTPITIAILGDRGENPFGAYLENIIKDRAINGRRLIIKQFASVSDPGLKLCHIIFICRSEKSGLGKILEDLKGINALTVTDMEQLPPSGVMVNFVMEESKVRFEINDMAAKQAGLKISSKLLSLAKNKGKGE